MLKKSIVVGTAMMGLAAVAAQQVKVIDLSWSNPTIAFLETHLGEMERDTPLDGLTICVEGKTQTADGKEYTQNPGNVWNKILWKYEAFEDAIRRYKALTFAKFTDNFFYTHTAGMDFNWCDDEDWRAVAANFGIAARVSKEMGLKGFLLDIEEYGKKFWAYGDDVHPKDISEEELEKVVFGRGQQWGKAVFDAYPDIILFMPFALGYNNLATVFVNGVLDVMPPMARIYDGCETEGYSSKSPFDYEKVTSFLQRNIRTKVHVENRAKARAQLLLSPAFYMDAYWPDDESYPWHRTFLPEIKEFGPLKFFKRNFLGAMREADPYIWVYGEKRCWWKESTNPAVKGRTWDEAPGAQGLSQAVNHLKNGELASADTQKNLLADPHFNGEGEGWLLWQVEDEKPNVPSPGIGEIGNGAAVAHKVTQGCFHQDVPVKPGCYYTFMLKGGCRQTGGKASVKVCFKSAQKGWLNHCFNVQLDMPNTGKLETCVGFVLAPEDAAYASFQCSVFNVGDTGEIYFTEACLSEL